MVKKWSKPVGAENNQVAPQPMRAVPVAMAPVVGCNGNFVTFRMPKKKDVLMYDFNFMMMVLYGFITFHSILAFKWLDWPEFGESVFWAEGHTLGEGSQMTGQVKTFDPNKVHFTCFVPIVLTGISSPLDSFWSVVGYITVTTDESHKSRATASFWRPTFPPSLGQLDETRGFFEGRVTNGRFKMKTTMPVALLKSTCVRSVYCSPFLQSF